MIEVPGTWEYAVMCAKTCDAPGCDADPVSLLVLIPRDAQPIRISMTCPLHVRDRLALLESRLRGVPNMLLDLPLKPGKVFDTHDVRDWAIAELLRHGASRTYEPPR